MDTWSYLYIISLLAITIGTERELAMEDILKYNNAEDCNRWTQDVDSQLTVGVKGLDYCLMLSTQKLTWKEAQENCTSLGGSLAHGDTFLAKYLLSHWNYEKLYMLKEGNALKFWTVGRSYHVSPDYYAEWWFDEEGNLTRRTDEIRRCEEKPYPDGCGYIGTDLCDKTEEYDTQVNKCEKALGFICKGQSLEDIFKIRQKLVTFQSTLLSSMNITLHNMVPYVVSDQNVSWDEASALCKYLGMSLIKNITKAKELIVHSKKKSSVWFGLRKDIDVWDSDYVISHGFVKQNCIMIKFIHPQLNILTYDNCSVKHYYMCEFGNDSATGKHYQQHKQASPKNGMGISTTLSVSLVKDNIQSTMQGVGKESQGNLAAMIAMAFILGLLLCATVILGIIIFCLLKRKQEKREILQSSNTRVTSIYDDTVIPRHNATVQFRESNLYAEADFPVIREEKENVANLDMVDNGPQYDNHGTIQAEAYPSEDRLAPRTPLFSQSSSTYADAMEPGFHNGPENENLEYTEVPNKYFPTDSNQKNLSKNNHLLALADEDSVFTSSTRDIANTAAGPAATNIVPTDQGIPEPLQYYPRNSSGYQDAASVNVELLSQESHEGDTEDPAHNHIDTENNKSFAIEQDNSNLVKSSKQGKSLERMYSQVKKKPPNNTPVTKDETEQNPCEVESTEHANSIDTCQNVSISGNREDTLLPRSNSIDSSSSNDEYGQPNIIHKHDPSTSISGYEEAMYWSKEKSPTESESIYQNPINDNSSGASTQDVPVLDDDTLLVENDVYQT